MHRHVCQVLEASGARPPAHHQVRAREQQPAHASALDARDPGPHLPQGRRDPDAEPGDAAVDQCSDL